MKKKQTGLGRGLSALIDDAALAEASGEIRSLPLHKIEPNPLQPRREFDPEALQTLADSIAAHGLIQPLSVREMPNGYYQIIAGERRWRAARMANLDEVPVLVLDADDRTVMELALVENLQREDLNPMEEAAGFQTLMDEYGLTQETIAERVGRSRSAVANSLRLLSLSDELADLVRSGTLSAGHARALLSLKDEKLRRQAAQRIMALQLSVRQAETLCRNLGKPKQKPVEQPLTVDYIAECEKSLSRHLGRKVKIVNGKRKGRFELEFYGPEDLNRLLFALQKTPIKEETKDG
ncbi:MAG: ParB/RepB/Spo0J family partition protein [Oscillospiraceae bacterium]|jgi:ParB family chromosome partitioning protein|nr:ParB/RepB/Spo0J family partition protein [Oscillospiraceae bacterium]MBQ1590283.1 ParB/RepB/Spo0J family partition protein [Oscillospiraceae bacterium]MBQ1756564.1 ParB/RepB/Spo0J family partition protein [Oscillospiraceae bacterium]MBQ2203198.1 ParB/RepB/Spo0J family partition protein [Oscillospiraceae bacterium]MBQ2329044.1 ParB/RepB/Spo0J family partition protein [Oscillospiraceae bacterium]